MDGRAERELHALRLQLLGDVAHVRNGAGQSVEFRHDHWVALVEGGKRRSSTWRGDAPVRILDLA